MAPRKKKEEQNEKQIKIKSISEIKEEISKRKPKAKFFDYKNDTLATRKDDIINLIDSEAKKFNDEAVGLKKEFLLALTYGNDIKATAQTMGIGRHRIYKLQETDPAFADCVDKIRDELEYEKVKDIENELLETKDVLSYSYEVLWENGLFKEAQLAIKEANRIKERFIERYDERKARKEDLKMREKELEISKGDSEEAKIININLGGEIRKIPNGILE